jgi:hypothetical protein
VVIGAGCFHEGNTGKGEILQQQKQGRCLPIEMEKMIPIGTAKTKLEYSYVFPGSQFG